MPHACAGMDDLADVWCHFHYAGKMLARDLDVMIRIAEFHLGK